MRRQGIAAAILTTAVLALAGCTAAPESRRASPNVAATASQSALLSTPMATPEDRAVVASLAFDGNCSIALSEDGIDELFGTSGHLLQRPDGSASRVLDNAAGLATGTLDCFWRSDSQSSYLHAVMAPVSSAPRDVDAEGQQAACGDNGWGSVVCTVSIAVSDTWLSLRASDEEILNQGMAVIGAALVGQTPTESVPPADAWAAPECADLVPMVQAAVPGGNAIVGFPSDADPENPFVDRLHAFGAMSSCGFMGYGQGTQAARVYFYSGLDVGSLVFSHPPIEIAGADRAYGADSGEQVAIVGSNAILVSGGNDATPSRAILEALIPAQTPRPATPTAEETE